MDARQFLMRFLSAGMRPLHEIEEAAETTGIAWSTIKRYKKLLGVETVRRGNAVIGWQMPPRSKGSRAYVELKKAREESKKLKVQLEAVEERIRLLQNVLRLSRLGNR